jgi:hypothetical protein
MNMTDDEFARHYNRGRRANQRMPYDLFVVIVVLFTVAAIITWWR